VDGKGKNEPMKNDSYGETYDQGSKVGIRDASPWFEITCCGIRISSF